jgi:hypothetical protein
MFVQQLEKAGISTDDIGLMARGTPGKLLGIASWGCRRGQHWCRRGAAGWQWSAALRCVACREDGL